MRRGLKLEKLVGDEADNNGQRCRPDEKGIETARRVAVVAFGGLGSAAAPMRRGLKHNTVFVFGGYITRGSAAAPMRRGLKLTAILSPDCVTPRMAALPPR